MTPLNRLCRPVQIGLWLACALVASPDAPAADLGQVTLEKFSVNSWTVEDGLPGNAVVALAKGGDGYLWLATLNGPARFDGARVVRVRLWDGLPSLLTQRLLADREGRLWIGTQDAGLTMLEGRKFRSFTRAEGLPGENVRGLAQDPQGGIWVATDEALVRWDGKFTNMTPPREKLTRGGFTSVCYGGGKIFGVSDDWRVWEWNGNSWAVLPPLGKAGFRFDQVFVTRAGVLWSQIYPTGLARLEEIPNAAGGEEQAGTTNQPSPGKQAWRIFGSECGLPNSYIYCALERTDGDFLFGSFERGLYHFQNDRATPVALNQPPDMDGVLALHADAEGNLWAGTRTRGVLRLREPRVRTLAGAEIVRIARLSFDNSGRFWIGGAEGLWFGRAGAISAVPLPERRQKWAVGAMLPAADGGVWFGAINGGLWRFNPDTDKKPVPQLPRPNSDTSVLSLATDRADGIWFGTAGGRIVHLGRGGLKWFSPEETAQKKISVLAADASGGVWAGSEGGGVLRLGEDGKVQLHLSREQGLPGKAVRSLLCDREGVVWIGTIGGLCRWDHSHLQVYDSRHGLPDEPIASLAEDDTGHLWCSANNALFRLEKSELEQIAAGRASVAHPMIVGSSDGLKPVPFASGISAEVMRGPEGRFYFPRIWDVLTLSPQDFEKPPPAPRPHIEEVLLDGQPVRLRPLQTSAVRVPPRRSQLEIRYTAFEWTAPESLRFRYRLADVDEDWTEAGDKRVATFHRLPPGSYRFEATAAAGGAEWAEPPASIAFVIEPMFWQTGWFRAAVLVALVGVAFAFYRGRIMRLEREQAAQREFSRGLIESQEKERKRIAAELHDSLEQNLLVIKNRALLALGQGEAALPLKESLEQISSVSSSSIEEVRTIARNLRPHQLDRLGLARALTAMLREAAESSGLRLTSEIAEIKGLLTKEAEINLYRIVQESLNNIIKHSGATEAGATLRVETNRLRLRIWDNGRGFDARTALSMSEGPGFGLAGMMERTKLLGGQLYLSSEPGRTELEAQIPFSSHSQESEIKN